MHTTSYTRVASRHIASMPRSACIVAAGKFGDSYCLLKNRDRNYLPKVKIVHEVRDGVEVAYMVDDSTGWVEGLNEFGVGIVNAALMVSRDESERDEVERTGKKLNDGGRILKALGEKTLQAAAKSVRTYKDGLKGHTLISDGKKTLYVEMPDSNDVEYDEVPLDELFVRTNHGVEFPDAGYVSGKNEKSSKSRQEQAEEVLAEVESPDDVAPALLRARDDRWGPTEMVRDNKSDRKMRTTSQMVLDLTERKLTFYVLPGRLDFEGVEDKLPKGHKPKLTVDVRVYGDLSEDTDGKTKKRSKEAGLLPILDPAFNIREIFKQLVLLEDHLFHPRKRCPDCIWKHLLTCEALAEEGVTLDLDRKHTDILDGLAERIRGLSRSVQGGAPFDEVAQKAREIRKGLLPVASMVRVARTDILDPALLEKNRKEVLLLAKAAESVRTLKNIPVLRKAVQKWTEAFERFGSSIREDLEGRVREAKAYEETGHRSKRPLSDKDWAQWYLDNMKPYWQLTTELWGVPQVPELKGAWGGKWEDPEVIRDRLREHFKEQYPADQVETQVESYMDRNPSISREEAEAKALASWIEATEPWARRVREKARATWKYLTDLSKWTTRSYLQMGGGEEPVKVVVPEDEHLTLEGFKMVFRGFDESPYKENLEPLKAGLHLYRERASKVLPLLLRKQLPMVVDWVFDPRDTGSGGAFYEYTFIRITPWFLTNDIKKFVEMAAHEMGHHLYKTELSGDGRKFWDTAIRGNYGDLDIREALSEVRSLGSGVSFFDKELALANPKLFLQLQTLMHDPAYKYMDVWDPDSAQRHLDRGGSPIFRVPQHPITGYAGKNTEEAFCEAVGRLVAHGPLVLPEEVRGWLRVVLPHIKIGTDNAVLDSGAFAPFKVGDFITYGKFQNKPGKIERLFVDEHGIPSIEIAAVGHARRKNRIMGLFRIRHMDMAKRVASRWAGTLLQFPTRAAPVRPKHTVTLGGRKYALSSDGGPLGDQLEGLSGGDGGGAKVVDIPAFMKPEPYRFLWAYDTEDGSVSMWRVTDGNSKVWGSADTLASKIVELERKGELNRVTSAEMAKLDRAMRKKENEQLQSMKKWLAENATEYQTFVDAVAWDVFNREVKPKVDKRLQEAKRGVVPFDFKVDESQLDYRSRGDQLRSHILTEEMAVFTVGAIEDEVKSRGVDPDAPDHDIQAAYWAMNDVVQAVWEKYSRFKIASDPLVSALRVVDAYLVEARRRWDDDETYLEWVQDALEPLVQAVRRVDTLWTGVPSRPATRDVAYVRDMLEGGRWIFYMADGGYSRLVLHGPGDPGPTMHFEVGLASAKTLPKWNQLVEQGLATKGGHLKVGYIKEPPFSPRQDLAQGFKFRVKSDSIGIVVRVYQGTTRVGGVVANWISRADSCAEDEAALRAQYPVLEKARVLYVWKAHLSDEVHNRGLGRAMYQAVMAAGFKYQGGPFLFTNTECWIGSGTSAMAKRVWASLARQYPSSGDMVAVLRPPTIASRDLDPERESKVAAGKYKEKKEVPKADGKGTTTVYVYSEKQVEHRHREKAKRYEGLSKDIDLLRKQVMKDIDAEDPKTRLTALAVGLIDATFERVGNESSADDGHFGVTGWLKEHLTFGKGTATIKYVGKSGVDHEKVVDDAKLVKALKGCCEDKKPGDPILSFGADDSEGPVKVTSQDVNEYLKPFDVTAKDLRGFHANREMQEALRSVRSKGPKLPSDKKGKEKLLKDEFEEALEATAEAVGHEAATLRTQYLVPGLQDAYEKDGTVMDKLKDASAHRVAARWVQATKSDAEREDEEVERLSRPVPKKKPSRDDSKRERIDIEAPEKPDKDLSMNYKDTGG